MTTQQNVLETIVATAGAGAVLYFCFTRTGQARLRRLEQWIEEGLSESSRLVDTFERAALIASAVGGVIGLVAKAQNDSYPDGRSAALDNLLALPSTLRHASQGATGR